MFYNDKFEHKRDGYVNNNFTELTTLGYIIGDLQQLDHERAEAMNLEYRKSYVFTTYEDLDIREGDKLIKDSKEYSVKAVLSAGHLKTSLNHKSVIVVC